jgi:hypothetical protein
MKAVATGMAIWGHLGCPGRVKAARSSLPTGETLLATYLIVVRNVPATRSQQCLPDRTLFRKVE